MIFENILEYSVSFEKIVLFIDFSKTFSVIFMLYISFLLTVKMLYKTFLLKKCYFIFLKNNEKFQNQTIILL